MMEDSGGLTLIDLQTCNHFLLSVIELEKNKLLSTRRGPAALHHVEREPITIRGPGATSRGALKISRGPGPHNSNTAYYIKVIWWLVIYLH